MSNSYIHISKDELQHKIVLARSLVEKRFKADADGQKHLAYQKYVCNFTRIRTSKFRVVLYSVLAIFGVKAPSVLTQEEFLEAARTDGSKSLPCAECPLHYFDDADSFISQALRNNDNRELNCLEKLIKTGKDPILLSTHAACVLERNIGLQN